MDEQQFDLPIEPPAYMRGIAAQTWQMFCAYMLAGFEQDQALFLLGQQIQVNARR